MDKKIRTPLTGRLGKPFGIAILYAVTFIPTNLLAIEHELAFPVPGIVSKIFVKKGDRVETGAPLARLDTILFSAKKQAADAAFSFSRIQHGFALEKMEQMQKLYDDVSISHEELQKSVIALARAKAGLEKARADLEIADWALKNAVLIAPRSGTVKRVDGYVGLVVDPKARFSVIVVIE